MLSGETMGILTQEIVDYLNAAGSGGEGQWLAQNPVVLNFVTCPYINIRPTAIPQAQRITAFDGQRGRYIDIHYRDGSHRYLIDVANWNLTVEAVEELIAAIDRVTGTCHVERSFLILHVPFGHVLQVENAGTGSLLYLCKQDAQYYG